MDDKRIIEKFEEKEDAKKLTYKDRSKLSDKNFKSL